MDLLNAIVNESLEKFAELPAEYENKNTKIEWLEYLLLCKSLEIRKVDIARLLLEKNYIVNVDIEIPFSTPLHYAVKLRDAEIVNFLLLKNASITSVDRDGNTPLHLAFYQSDNLMIDLFIKKIQDTSNYDNKKNLENLSHLHIVCTRPYSSDVIKGFLTQGANIDDRVSPSSPRWKLFTALHFAAKYRSSKSLKTLMEWAETHIDEFDLNQLVASAKATPLDLITRQLNSLQDMYCRLINKAHLTFNNSDGSTALHCAVREGSIVHVQFLLKKDYDIEAVDRQLLTPLHLAFYRETHKNLVNKNYIVDLLYAALKKKIGKAESWKNHCDENGLSYLHIAATQKDIQMAKKFLGEDNVNAEVRLNSQAFSYFTPLHFAVKYGDDEMIQFLIENGAYLNKNSTDGTALHIACELGRCNVIDLLLNNKVDFNIGRIRDGKTALQVFYSFYDNIESVDEKNKIQEYMRRLK